MVTGARGNTPNVLRTAWMDSTEVRCGDHPHTDNPNPYHQNQPRLALFSRQNLLDAPQQRRRLLMHRLTGLSRSVAHPCPIMFAAPWVCRSCSQLLARTSAQFLRRASTSMRLLSPTSTAAFTRRTNHYAPHKRKPCGPSTDLTTPGTKTRRRTRPIEQFAGEQLRQQDRKAGR